MKHSVLTLGGVKGWGVGGRAVGGLEEGGVGGMALDWGELGGVGAGGKVVIVIVNGSCDVIYKISSVNHNSFMH